MTECLSVIKRLQSCLEAGQQAALAMVIERHGSAPRDVGAMLLRDQHGRMVGTVGGGLLEHEVIRELEQVLHSGKAMVRDFELLPHRFGMICGGRMRLLLAPVRQEHKTVFDTISNRLEQGNACILHAALDRFGQAVWGDRPSDEEAVCAVNLEPAPRLLIFGAGHIAQALAPMALSAGFGVLVLDDRPDYLSSGLFGDGTGTRLVSSFEGCLADLPIHRSTALLIATYGHQHDLTVLNQALATEAGYIGMVGSRRKRDALFVWLREGGVSDAGLARVRCPVGLPIGAETPAEIAVSILAEMIAFRRQAA